MDGAHNRGSIYKYLEYSGGAPHDFAVWFDTHGNEFVVYNGHIFYTETVKMQIITLFVMF